MIDHSEIITFLIGIGVLIFILVNYSELKRLPSAKILIAAFCVMLAGWTFTILEGFFWKNILNFAEHLSYAISSVLLAAWCWRVFKKSKDEQP